MAFPSVVTTFVNPQATDKLNSPSHSSIETAQNTGLTEVQTFLGTTNTSVVGTLIYDVRSPSSNGGGHVQSANKGGTGQTLFSKGDLLVATSSSVISKQTIGSSGQVLTVDLNQSTGVRWNSPSGGLLAMSYTPSTLSSIGTANASLISTTLSGSTLGTGAGVTLRTWVTHFEIGDAPNGSVLVAGVYGNSRFASIFVVPDWSNGSVAGTIDLTLMSKGVVSSQFGIMELNIRNVRTDFLKGNGSNAAVSIISAIAVGNISVDSDADQKFGVTTNYGHPLADDDKIITQGYIVKKL